MKNIFSFAAVSLLVSCGNPHISSTKNGIERTNPPLEQEACVPGNVHVSDYKFFFGSEKPVDYKNFVKCKNVISEDFNIFSVGNVPELSNQGRTDQPYVLTHRSEVPHDPEKVVTLEQIFGTSVYDFMVQNPVTNNGMTGVDRGANSGSVSSSAMDALVWKFSTPVSFWSAQMVGLKNNSTVRIYNCADELVKAVKVYGSPKFVGFISEFQLICGVSVSSASGSDAVAVDAFEYGN